MPGRSSAWSRSRLARPRHSRPHHWTDVLRDVPRTARGRRSPRPRAARRAGSVPPGRRDRGRPRDRLGHAGAPLVPAPDPDRRGRAVSRGPAGRPRHLVQRAGGDRGRTALVAPWRPRRPCRGRQRLDPSRPGSAAGQDRGLRHLRRRRRRPAGLDEAGAARSAGGRRRPPVAAACERHRPARPRQQRRLLAGRRARASGRPASIRHVRSSPSSTTASRSTSATRSSSSPPRKEARWSWAFARRTGSGPWRG